MQSFWKIQPRNGSQIKFRTTTMATRIYIPNPGIHRCLSRLLNLGGGCNAFPRPHPRIKTQVPQRRPNCHTHHTHIHTHTQSPLEPVQPPYYTPYYICGKGMRALGGIQKNIHGVSAWGRGSGGPISASIDSRMVAIRQLSIGCRHFASPRPIMASSGPAIFI